MNVQMRNKKNVLIYVKSASNPPPSDQCIRRYVLSEHDYLLEGI